ncbi:alkyl sulfatase BDS1-like metallo-beta-lactamase superfamily hydrolase [Methanolinea mesophila]|uniref:alkyl/aryl-sulfatase n=1 Tax=Methanolinea mesophila TaxID=547055 RepID=UPI001AE8D0DE|nr:alkyl sulfatase dimerization domain-containing protein [Methanolinea mesophila]MBP1927735.1 alkyl sulfatase BDS1-like metallo-beta-lactamase superfamily hydrolase [Methanolinea mesophila]
MWRQSQLVVKAGLYKVVDRLYQVRTADLSNLTIVEGDTGLIIIDPLVSTETAGAALDLYYQHRPKKPVIAVVHSHSHVDHYGGVKGVVSEEDVKAGKAMIVAPAGFLDAAVSENVLAGTAMSRRATYMYGNLLPPGPRGMVGAGLGMSTSSGTVTLIPPTHEITATGQRMRIDGLDFEFLLAPGTEAPAEMHWYIEQLKALTAAENCCHTLHNTYTLRGASIRDPQAWSKYLNQTIDMWGDKSEVMYGMHHWPVWGRERVLEILTKGRDCYRYINDQTLRLANHGYTPVEIAEQFELPPELAGHWALRPYYGTFNHNVKATYVKYLGWFDGNPANLHVLPPEAAAKNYVAMMGGADAVVEKAAAYFARGEYRWVAEVVKHVVFADPGHKGARELLADTFEQLGYRAESGPWRNFYLTGAKELREGVMQLPAPNSVSPDSVRAMSLDTFFDYLGVRLNGPKAVGKKSVINLNFTDTGEQAVLVLVNATLNHSLDRQDPHADATLTLTRNALNRIILQESTFDKEVGSGGVQVAGNAGKVHELVSLLDSFEFWFNIVTP